MVLKTNNLFYSYPGGGELAFPNISLKERESALLLGPSGKGKTTFLHLVSGLLPLQKGNIEVAETALGSLSGRSLDRFRGKHIGMVFQKSHFLPYLTIGENLRVAQKITAAKKGDQVADSLGQLGVEHLIDKKPAQCSVGEQQRASIARALLGKPALILADEPTSALDDQNTHAVTQMLKQAVEEHGASLLIVTHDQRLNQHFSKHFAL